MPDPFGAEVLFQGEERGRSQAQLSGCRSGLNNAAVQFAVPIWLFQSGGKRSDRVL